MLTVPTLLFEAVNKAIALTIAQQPDVQQRLQPLAGKVVTVTLLPWASVWQLRFSLGGVQMSVTDAHHGQGAADLAITGYVDDLLNMLRGQSTNNRQALEVKGDLQLAQQLQSIMKHVQWSRPWDNEQWPPLMSSMMQQGVSHISKLSQHWFSQLRQDGVEYVQDEINILAHPEAVREWLHEVDLVRDKQARLAARLTHLERISIKP
ncbi:MAG: SCP2 sterol-binding domain-containing protein [Gammaproteobacteria bacterium]|nr:SCP2 sterol-binding domain-containing protein [Gammaproteobacteria bacterium]